MKSRCQEDKCAVLTWNLSLTDNCLQVKSHFLQWSLTLNGRPYAQKYKAKQNKLDDILLGPLSNNALSKLFFFNLI